MEQLRWSNVFMMNDWVTMQKRIATWGEKSIIAKT